VNINDSDKTDVKCKDVVDQIISAYSAGMDSESQERELMVDST